MKRLLLFFLPVIALIILVPRVFAQEATSSGQPTATMSSTIQYTLPYPRILPDNPLYFIKALRDEIVGFLIIDPVKKFQFYLLNSDKRVWAGQMLFDKQEYSLGITTVSKSNNYMFEAESKLASLLPTRKDLNAERLNMLTSIKKHQQIIQDMIDTSPSKYQQALKYEQQRLDGFAQLLQNSHQ